MAGTSTGNGLRDVVVTGYALTTSVGTDADSTWAALLAGESGIRLLTDGFVAEYDLPVRIGGKLIEDFDPHLTSDEVDRWSYVQRMAVVLGRRAWAHAGHPEVEPRRLAVSLGTGMGATEELYVNLEALRDTGVDAVSPTAVPTYMPNAAAATVAREFGARASVTTPVSACASGSEGVAQAWRQLAYGDADVALCGGVETKIGAVPIAAFAQMRIVMSSNNDDPAGACRPFDAHRDGFVFGEGGAVLVLETEEHARARGATILGRVLGAAVTSDGFHMVAPDPNGERAGFAMTRALQLAGLAPGDIGHVNAHATGTSVGDVAESAAINRALGKGGNNAVVYAPKSALGHSVGAVGAVETVLALLALREQVVPPTLNLRDLDPEVDLDVVSGAPRPGRYDYAINNSFGFGGHNVAIALGRN